MKPKSKGGPRPGAGRKPSPNPKLPITFYVEATLIENCGGFDEFKRKGYDFFNSLSVFLPQVAAKTNDGQFEVREAAPEEIGKPVTVTFSSPDKVKLNLTPAAKDAILKQIEAIKAEKCPKDRDTYLGRKSWAKEQKDRIEALQNQLQ